MARKDEGDRTHYPRNHGSDHCTNGRPAIDFFARFCQLITATNVIRGRCWTYPARHAVFGFQPSAERAGDKPSRVHIYEDELIRFRAEAAELLGVDEKAIPSTAPARSQPQTTAEIATPVRSPPHLAVS